MKKEYICPAILLQGVVLDEVLVGTSDTEFNMELLNDAKERQSVDFSDEESIW